MSAPSPAAPFVGFSFGDTVDLASVATAASTATLAAGGTPSIPEVRNDPGDPTFNQLLGINNAGTIAGYFGIGGSTGNILHPNVGRFLVPPSNQSVSRNPMTSGGIERRGIGDALEPA